MALISIDCYENKTPESEYKFFTLCAPVFIATTVTVPGTYVEYAKLTYEISHVKTIMVSGPFTNINKCLDIYSRINTIKYLPTFVHLGNKVNTL